MNIHVHIDRIILDGIATTADQTGVVESAVNDELVRLLAVHGISAAIVQAGNVPSLQGGPLQVRPDTPPAALGVGIGHAIHRGLLTTEPASRS